MRNTAIYGLVPALTLACAGNVRVTTLPPAELEVGHSHKGVIYYLPTYARTTFSYTAYVDETTKALTMACDTVVQKEEVSLLADLDRPVVVRNASGMFSAAKFGVTLDKGMLASVNVEPTQKASELLTGVAALVKEVGGPSTEAAKLAGRPACNAAPIVTAIRRIQLK